MVIIFVTYLLYDKQLVNTLNLMILQNTKILMDIVHIADLEELKENEFNLDVPRYVDISETDEEMDIKNTIDELRKLENNLLS